MTQTRFDRRSVLTQTGALVLVGALAGCSGAGGSSGDGGGDDGPFASVQGANGYDGSPTDATGKDSVIVHVGANNGYAFDPAALTVSTGTTVTWKWVGKGGGHNVVAENGDFESELTSEEGHTFSHTFDDAGVWPYYCRPHRSMGMKGAVQVVE